MLWRGTITVSTPENRRSVYNFEFAFSLSGALIQVVCLVLIWTNFFLWWLLWRGTITITTAISQLHEVLFKFRFIMDDSVNCMNWFWWPSTLNYPKNILKFEAKSSYYDLRKLLFLEKMEFQLWHSLIHS